MKTLGTPAELGAGEAALAMEESALRLNPPQRPCDRSARAVPDGHLEQLWRLLRRRLPKAHQSPQTTAALTAQN